MDRGGLIYISDTLYSLFLAMELELRVHLHVDSKGSGAEVREQVVANILENEDVQHFWTAVSSSWEEKEAEE